MAGDAVEGKGNKMEERNFFSWENLKELTGTEDHLAFAEQIAEKYADETVLKESIRRIRDRQDDKKLNISVIGEFSTGKSTLINALLGYDLLVYGSVQGTTAADIVITYGKEFRIDAEYTDKRGRRTYMYEDFISMKNDLDRFTSDPDPAKRIRSIKTFLPAEFLGNDIRIIDTPGVNAAEAWHEERTLYVIKEFSDMSVIVLSAMQLIPDSMISFIKSNLMDALGQCVFVITNLDRIRPEERQGVLDYIRVRLSNEFGLEEPLVLPYVSVMVLEERLEGGFEGAEVKMDEELYNTSLKTEKILAEQAAKKRLIAQNRKIAELLSRLYESVSGQLDLVEKCYDEQLKVIEKSRSTDLETFAGKAKEERCRHFEEWAEAEIGKMDSAQADLAEKTVDNLVKNLDSCTNVDKLNGYIHGKLKNDCTAGKNKMIGNMNGVLAEIRTLLTGEIAYFEKTFKAFYESLQIMPVDMDMPVYELPPAAAAKDVNLSSAIEYINTEKKKDGRKFWSSGAAGAAVGTMIAPGVGTLIGGFIGAAAGSAFGESINEVRAVCASNIREEAGKYYKEIRENNIKAAREYADRIKGCLEGIIDSYLEAYRSEVSRSLKENDELKEAVCEKKRDLKCDMERVDSKRLQLASVMEKLKCA